MPTRGRKRAQDAVITGVVAMAVVGLLRVTGEFGGLPPPPVPIRVEPPPTTAVQERPPRIAPVVDEDLIEADLYVADGRRVLVVDIVGRSVRSLPVPGTGRLTSALRHGSTVVFRSAGTVSVLPDGADELLPIGAADDVLPSSGPLRLWLARQSPGSGRPAWEITPVQLDGEPLRDQAIRVVPGQRPLAVMAGDTAVLTTDGSGLLVYDLPPSGRALGRPRVAWPGASFVDSLASMVALVDGRGELRITDLNSGVSRTVQRPSDVARWAPSAGMGADRCCRRLGAFSPDGGTLAITVENRSGEDSISVVYTTNLVVRAVPRSSGVTGASCLPCFDWLPSGGWLLFARDEPLRLSAYRLGHRWANPLRVQASSGRLSFALR